MVSGNIRSNSDQDPRTGAEDDGTTSMNFSSAQVKLQYSVQVPNGAGVEGGGIRTLGVFDTLAGVQKCLYTYIYIYVYMCSSCL